MADIIKIKFVGENPEDIFTLEYELFENPFVTKWKKLFKRSQRVTKKVENNGSFFGKAFDTIEDLCEKLNYCIDKVNEYSEKNYPEGVIKIRPEDRGPDRQFLNELHLLFEELEPLEIYRADREVLDILKDMNIYIHRAEEFLPERDDDGAHVEMLFTEYFSEMFSKEDYDYFTPDNFWGYMYLTYGITGVPTFNAYFADTIPRPQDRFSNGIFLSFKEDMIFPDEIRDKMAAWYKEKFNQDLNDPEMALGYIPLGKVLNPFNSKSELIAAIADRQHIEEVLFVEDEKVETVTKTEHIEVQENANNHISEDCGWPLDPEVYLHLDLVPYLDLDIKFDAKKLLNEAQRAQNYFVVHRNYDQTSGQEKGKWKSLGLRTAMGDYKKTQYHLDYGIEERCYEQTPFAHLCPETMKLISQITDIEQCDRIRFMLLEPGARIHPHSDARDRDVSVAVNISLNMPDECYFMGQLNSDGSVNEYSRHIPFKDEGSVILFNNAKYHSVVNHSMTNRFQIIFHGPIKLKDETLLKLARKQNGFENKEDLIRAVLEKKAVMKEPLRENAPFYNDLIVASDRCGVSLV